MTPASQAPSKRPSTIFLIVATGLLVRLVLFLVVHGLYFQDQVQGNQSSLYNETTNVAASLARGQGFTTPFLSTVDGSVTTGPSAWLTPAYPLFCAAVFRVLGTYSRQSFMVILLLQCVMGALTCIPIARLGELTVSRRAGLIAALLWAIFPWFSKWDVTWIWEMSASALLVSWLVVWALELERASSMRKWLSLGALWGLALLVNPALLTLFAVSLIWLAWRRIQWRGLALCVFTAAVVISPWMIRNRAVMGQWVFLRDNFWFEFNMSNYHGTYGQDSSAKHPASTAGELKQYESLGELRYIGVKESEARQFLREYPAEFASVTAKRVLWFWSGRQRRFADPIPWYWVPWSFLPISVLTLVGLFLAWRRGIPIWPLLAVLLALYPWPYYITYGQLRYRHAVEPLMLVVISGILEKVPRRVRGEAENAVGT